MQHRTKASQSVLIILIVLIYLVSPMLSPRTAFAASLPQDGTYAFNELGALDVADSAGVGFKKIGSHFKVSNLATADGSVLYLDSKSLSGNFVLSTEGSTFAKRFTFHDLGISTVADSERVLSSLQLILKDPAGNELFNKTVNHVVFETGDNSIHALSSLLGESSFDQGNVSSVEVRLVLDENELSIAPIEEFNFENLSISKLTPAGSNADLSSLAISSGTLNPVFSSGETSYTASVSNETENITVTPTLTDPNATVLVNGNAVNSGSPSALIPLAVGSNTITVATTADNGTTIKTYSLIVTRAAPASSNADLSNLTLSSGAPDPTFASGTMMYTANVTHSVNSLTVTPTVDDPNATVTVNGTTVTSGSPSGSIDLNVGANTITIIVTAQSGSTKTYTVKVARPGSSNANLSNLELSDGSLDPTFDNEVTSYTVEVANSVSGITLTPTVADSTATVTVDGAPVTSGNPSGIIGLNVGKTTISVIVTAQDNSTKTYDISVNRATSSNADLSDLALSDGTLNPTFSSNQTSYVAQVPNLTSTITVTPNAEDLTATVTVNGSTVISGSASDPINLSVGVNTLTILVTAENASTQTYIIEVTRAGSSNADLSNLTLSDGTLDPLFDSNVIAYTVELDNSVDALMITPTADDPTALIAVNGTRVLSGNASDPIPLNVGDNVLTVQVSAEDSSTKTYTVTVTRAASSNNNLSQLELSDGTLSPSFASSTTAYTVTVTSTVNSLILTPTVEDSTAAVTVNDAVATSGSPSMPIALDVGNNTITIKVTAQDQSIKTYLIDVERIPSSDADLEALALSAGTLDPAFSSEVFDYTATVSSTEDKILVTPTASDPYTVVTVNDLPIVNGSSSGPINLDIGSNTITVKTLAQDGSTTRTYTIAVTRAPAPQPEPEPPTPGEPSSGGTPAVVPTPAPAPTVPTAPPTALNVVINGVQQDQFAQVQAQEREGRPVTAITLESSKITERLNTEGPGSTIIVPVPSSNDIVSLQLGANLLQTIKESSAILNMRTPDASYTIPAAQIDLNAAVAQLGASANPNDVSYRIEISKGNPEQIGQTAQAAANTGATLIGDPVSFTLHASYNGRSVELSRFGTYIKREIALPTNVDPNQITTGVVLDESGQIIRHVPTYVRLEEGRYYAQISSRTNSVYAVIWNPLTFADAEGLWAQEDINDMGSRLIVKGFEDGTFKPSQSVTRAEFATILVRALGLPEDGMTGDFSDITAGNWAAGAISTASDYGLVTGYTDETFRPDNTIARQEAMVMLQRALNAAEKNTAISSEQVDQLLADIPDQADLGEWSAQAAAVNVQLGLIRGNEKGQIRPNDELTRAETAAIVRRMLRGAGLIN